MFINIQWKERGVERVSTIEISEIKTYLVQNSTDGGRAELESFA
jgi:hypothetical protein